MAIIKCKMCGGVIELSGDKTIGTCDSCGSKMTLPKIDDEQRAATFNRGNHFRRIGEFDKALAVYERIVQENDSDAEAHWCCALCRFGIEYVEDPTTYEWLPTCHRASFDSFLEDVDYLAAVEHSDGVTRRQYQKEAERIAEIQRNILATSQNEQPFDVFICYKESDENGERTRDSAVAQDIYYQLTEQGFRVFFARITLEDKVGSQYEPYIFAALNSAKVMIVVGTKPEYMNAVWVKNEWSRFLALMKRDRSKLLLPCYRDMDPYDLPEQLSVLQAYDMSKIGFIQDLIRGVSKVLGKDKKPEAVRETVVVQSEGGTNNDALLKRGQQALEDGEWQKADSFFDRVLDSDAECAEAFIGKFLAAKQQVSLMQYVDQQIAQARQVRHEVKLVDVDRSRIEQVVERCTVPNHLGEEKIRSLYECNLGYQTILSPLKKKCDQVRQQWEGEKLLTRAFQFATGAYGEQIESERRRLFDIMDALVAQAEQQDEQAIAKIREAYARHLDEADQKASDLHQKAVEQKERDEARRQAETKKRDEEAARQREEDYQKACRQQNESKSAAQATNVANAFSKLGNYKDSEARARACREKAEQLKKRGKTRTAVVLTIVALVIVAAVLAVTVIIPSVHYKAGEAALSDGDYDTARAEFRSAGNYRDANERVLESYYRQGNDLLDQEIYDDAREMFDAAIPYRDAAERVLEIFYIEAETELANEQIAKAAILFGKAGHYSDANQRSFELWDQITTRKTITVEHTLSAALKADGTVVAINSSSADDIDVSDWSDIIGIDSGSGGVVGLKADRTVIAAGSSAYGWQQGVSGWHDIASIVTLWDLVFGIRKDGTVVVTEEDGREPYDAVSDWTDIISIACYSSTFSDHIIGLRADGTVVAAGDHTYNGQCDVGDWNDIVAVSTSRYHTVGLKADGTVVAAGKNEYGECDVSTWSGIVAVIADDNYTVGLKENGTVVAVGRDTRGRCDVSNWHDIVSLIIGYESTLGLTAHGRVVALGQNDYGELDVSDWQNIVAIDSSLWRTIGLRADGTVVEVGDNKSRGSYRLHDVSEWQNIRVP